MNDYIDGCNIDLIHSLIGGWMGASHRSLNLWIIGFLRFDYIFIRFEAALLIIGICLVVLLIV